MNYLQAEIDKIDITLAATVICGADMTGFYVMKIKRSRLELEQAELLEYSEATKTEIRCGLSYWERRLIDEMTR